MKNELTVIENVELVPFFTKGDNLDSVLEQIEREAMAFVAGDLSIKKNRDAVKAMVTKVTKSKTYLESQGKELAAEYKEIPKRIDANRKKTKDFLNDLQSRVRQPLTDWEAEEARVKAEEDARIEAEKIKAEIESDHEIALLMDEKFNRELADKLAEEKRIEEERQAQLEKERQEREARIAEEARLKAEQEAKEREEGLERERLAAVAREEQAKRDAIAAEEREKIQAEKAKQDAIDAENKRIADIEAVKQAEIKRQKDEAARAKAEEEKRKANEAHSLKVMTQTKESIMALGLSEGDARKVTIALKNGQIANVAGMKF